MQYIPCQACGRGEAIGIDFLCRECLDYYRALRERTKTKKTTMLCPLCKVTEIHIDNFMCEDCITKIKSSMTDEQTEAQEDEREIDPMKIVDKIQTEHLLDSLGS